MIPKLLKFVLGTRNDRQLKKWFKTVSAINAVESGLKDLSNEQLKDKTSEFRERLANGESLWQVLPEAFAVVREVALRQLNMRHFDVQ